MKLTAVSRDEVLTTTKSKGTQIKELLDEFINSNATCVRIDGWDEISKTVENFRTTAKNHPKYHKENNYNKIRIITSKVNGTIYFVKEDE